MAVMAGAALEAPRVVAADFYIKNKCRPARPPRAARCAR